MKEKIIIVTSCAMCPYFNIDYDICKKSGDDINLEVYYNCIPDDCPLEDKKEE
jgi:hypothetical protein